MSNTTIQLQYPVKISGVEVTELTFRRAKLKDVKKAFSSSNNGKDELKLTDTMILSLNQDRITPAELDEVDASDYAALSKMVEDFLA